MTGGLTLSELLARDPPLQWFEGIAIVRGVAASLLEQQGRHPLALPELHQIDLRDDGAVVITGEVEVAEPVRRLGQLLQATLTDTEVPVQLRLIVSQATAPMPLYKSVAEFDQALAYFERPDRAGLLKALVAKAAAIGPETARGPILALDEIAPLPGTPAVTVPGPRKTVRRSIGLAAVLAAAVAVTAGAVFYSRNADFTAGARAASDTTLAAADTLGAAVMAGVSAVSERAGMGRLVSGKEAAAESAAAETAAVSEVQRLLAVRVAVRAEAVTTPDSTFPPRAMLIFDAPDEPAGAGPDTGIGEASTPEPATAADLPLDSIIYTSAAGDVAPPVDVRPRLPRQLPQDVDIEKLSRIELIVGRDGSVESARLLGDRADVQGGMFLSAAKSWVYRPAMKDGVAVRFRKLILVCFE
jgi:hypothetical protein